MFFNFTEEPVGIELVSNKNPTSVAYPSLGVGGIRLITVTGVAEGDFQRNSAWFQSPVLVAGGFYVTWDFTFTEGADGVAFILQNRSRPRAPWSSALSPHHPALRVATSHKH